MFSEKMQGFFLHFPAEDANVRLSQNCAVFSKEWLNATRKNAEKGV